MTSTNSSHVLASHEHFYMDGIFNTDYWKQHGGVLPGWIIGTAGAVRYALPPKSSDARGALTNVYGSALATVQPSGEISFEFEKLDGIGYSGVRDVPLRQGFRALVLRGEYTGEIQPTRRSRRPFALLRDADFFPTVDYARR